MSGLELAVAAREDLGVSSREPVDRRDVAKTAMEPDFGVVRLPVGPAARGPEVMGLERLPEALALLRGNPASLSELPTGLPLDDRDLLGATRAACVHTV